MILTMCLVVIVMLLNLFRRDGGAKKLNGDPTVRPPPEVRTDIKDGRSNAKNVPYYINVRHPNMMVSALSQVVVQNGETNKFHEVPILCRPPTPQLAGKYISYPVS